MEFLSDHFCILPLVYRTHLNLLSLITWLVKKDFSLPELLTRCENSEISNSSFYNLFFFLLKEEKEA